MSQSSIKMTLEVLRMLSAYLPYCEHGLRAKGALEMYIKTQSELCVIGSLLTDAVESLKKAQERELQEQRSKHTLKASSDLRKALGRLEALSLPLSLPLEIRAERDVLLAEICQAQVYAEHAYDDLLSARRSYDRLEVILEEMRALGSRVDSYLNPSALLTAFEGYEVDRQGFRVDVKAWIEGVNELGELWARQIDEHEHALKARLEAFGFLLQESLSTIDKACKGDELERVEYIFEACFILNRALDSLEAIRVPLGARGEYGVLWGEMIRADTYAQSDTRDTQASLYALKATLESAWRAWGDLVDKITHIQRADREVKLGVKLTETIINLESDVSQELFIKAVCAWLFGLLEISDMPEGYEQDPYLKRFLAMRERMYEGVSGIM